MGQQTKFENSYNCQRTLISRQSFDEQTILCDLEEQKIYRREGWKQENVIDILQFLNNTSAEPATRRWSRSSSAYDISFYCLGAALPAVRPDVDDAEKHVIGQRVADAVRIIDNLEDTQRIILSKNYCSLIPSYAEKKRCVQLLKKTFLARLHHLENVDLSVLAKTVTLSTTLRCINRETPEFEYAVKHLTEKLIANQAEVKSVMDLVTQLNTDFMALTDKLKLSISPYKKLAITAAGIGVGLTLLSLSVFLAPALTGLAAIALVPIIGTFLIQGLNIYKMSVNYNETQLTEQWEEVKAYFSTLQLAVKQVEEVIMRIEIDQVRTDVQAFKTDVQAFKTDVQAFKTDVQAFKTDVKADVKADVKTYVNEFRTELEQAVSGQKNIYNLVTNVSNNVQHEMKQQNNELENLKLEILMLESNNQSLKNKIAKVEQEQDQKIATKVAEQLQAFFRNYEATRNNIAPIGQLNVSIPSRA